MRDMKPTQMTTLQFIELLETYGAQPSRWPDAQRRNALVFAEKFEDAQTLLNEARALDTVLDTSSAPAPSELLRARILKGAGAPKPQSASNAKILPLRAIAATLLVGIFVGLSSGYFSLQSPNASPDETQALYAEQSYDWLDEVFPSDLDLQDTP